MDIDHLGRCEYCGIYIPEVELNSIELEDTKTGKVDEYLLCQECVDYIDDLLDPDKPRYKRTRPERKP